MVGSKQAERLVREETMMEGDAGSYISKPSAFNEWDSLGSLGIAQVFALVAMTPILPARQPLSLWDACRTRGAAERA